MALRWDDVVGRLEPGPAPGFYRPRHQRSIAGILPTALELLGLEPGPSISRLEEVPPAAAGRRFKKLFFCLIDSLGLDDLLGRDGPLSRWLQAHGTWLTSVFPTITSSAICSITHGVPPAAHGIYGHKVWSQRAANVVDMLTLKPEGHTISLPDAGVDVATWTRTQPLLGRALVGDLPCYHVTHKDLIGSGLSNFVYPPNVTRIGYGPAIEGYSKVKQLLEREDRAIVSFYTSSIDLASHVFGKRSPEFAHQLGDVERALEWVVSQLSPRARSETLFALASDHGQSLFDPARAIRLSASRQELYRSWGPHHGLGNSGRVLHLYGEGAPPAEVAEALAADVDGRGVVLEAAEAFSLAGAPDGSPVLDDGLGARVVVLDGGAYFEFEQTPERIAANARNLDRLVSNHGSLTAEELLVPTVLAGMDELGREQ